MNPVQLLSAVEQVAAHLRAELLRGRWSNVMPGGDGLAAELGVSKGTMASALRLLEKQGWLEKQGRRRPRLIHLPRHRQPSRPLRIAILDYDTLDLETTYGYMVELRHLLMEAGYRAFIAPQSLQQLGMNVRRVARLVKRTKADAWVVCAAAREVLEWFVAEGVPAFAIFGRWQGLPIPAAGPDKRQAFIAATRRLIELGHRRIVLLSRRERRLPEPGGPERAFLDELAAHGIRPGPYQLPDWQESAGGFRARLELLFRVTPPTALMVDEPEVYLATLQFLMERRLRVPQEVSLVCTDNDRAFNWCQPKVAHMDWDSRPVLRRVLRWADQVARGRPDVRQTLIPARFVEGGTIGPSSQRST